MNVQVLGAAGTVTGSKYLLSTNSRKVLIDCGLFQGYKPLRLRNWDNLPFHPADLDAVVLTHAHLDHSGYLPSLIKQGFRGKIYCTKATFDLCKILLPDSGHLQEEDAEYANRRGFSKHQPALPLYTEADAVNALKYFSGVEFGATIKPAPGFEVEFAPAGHILGAAIVKVKYGGTSITFSGDLGRLNDLIMVPPAFVEKTDYLVVESTYGNRRHDPADPLELLGKTIRETANRGGIVIIPAFAVGRAQLMLYYIQLLKQAGAIPALLPVYLNSPMAKDATALYHKHRTQHRLSYDECESIHTTAKIVNSVEESKWLNQQRMPMVIIAASGMATGGRVLHHLKSFAPDPRNTILFAGYQAGGTRGASMLAGAESIKIHGQFVPLRAQVVQIENLSAHADSDEIMTWLSHFSEPPKMTFITHGEQQAAEALKERVTEELHWNCLIPQHEDIVRLAGEQG